LESIINASVFLPAFVYLMICISAATFFVQGRECTNVSRFGGTIPALGVACSLPIMAYVGPLDILLAVAFMGLGAVGYLAVDVRRRKASGR
jgi:hypothetical protein